MKRLIPILSIIIFLASCEEETKRLDNYAVHGIDISRYQANVDWDVVAAQDIEFAFVKASEGSTHQDIRFCENWDEIKRVNLKRGAYHFYRPTVSAEIQANNFIDLVEMEAGDLPPVLDIEVLDGVSKINLINGLRTWLMMVEIHYNIKPIIYTNQKFYNKYIAGNFSDYPIWIARYHSWKEPSLANTQDWDFWQYGNRGRLEGIEGNVDFNVFKGNLFELEKMCLAPRMVFSEK